MYAPEFDYYRAGSVAEVGDLLRKYPGAKLLAGGHSLIPLLKLRLASPPAVIDIGRIAELKGIGVKDGKIRIGALTTHAELAASKELRERCPRWPKRRVTSAIPPSATAARSAATSRTP